MITEIRSLLSTVLVEIFSSSYSELYKIRRVLCPLQERTKIENIWQITIYWGQILLLDGEILTWHILVGLGRVQQRNETIPVTPLSHRLHKTVAEESRTRVCFFVLLTGPQHGNETNGILQYYAMYTVTEDESSATLWRTILLAHKFWIHCITRCRFKNVNVEYQFQVLHNLKL